MGRCPTIFVASANFATRSEDLLGGVVSFLLNLLPELGRGDHVDIAVVALQFRGLPAHEVYSGITIHRLAVEESASYGIHELNSLPEPEYMRVARSFGQRAFAFVEERAQHGDVCMLNDFFQNGDLASLRRRGLHLSQACHILPSEYIFHEYIGDIFSGDREDMKTRIPPGPRQALWLMQHTVRNPKQLVQAFSRLSRSRVGRLVPSLVRYPFDKERESMEECNSIVVPTTIMRDKILDCYPIPRGRVRVIPWGVDEAPPEHRFADQIRLLRDQFQVPADATVLLTLSRISPEKGIEYLIDALTHLEKQHPAVASKLVLFVCGRPSLSRGQSYAEDLKRRAAALTRVKVHFPGFVAGTAKDAFLYMADIYIMPSKYESFGLTMLEAMSRHTAVIASDTDGSRDVLDEKFGRMLSFDHPTERRDRLANAIVELFSADLRAMGRAAHKRSLDFSWTWVADEFLSAFGLPRPP